MLQLTLLLHAIIATVIMGIGIIAALVLGFVSATAIVTAVAAGLLLGFPPAWLIAKKLHEG